MKTHHTPTHRLPVDSLGCHCRLASYSHRCDCHMRSFLDREESESSLEDRQPSSDKVQDSPDPGEPIFKLDASHHSCLCSHQMHPCNVESHHRDAGSQHTGPHWGRTPDLGHIAQCTGAHHYHPCSLSRHHSARPEAHTAHQRHSWTHRIDKLEVKGAIRKQSTLTNCPIKDKKRSPDVGSAGLTGGCDGVVRRE